MRTILYTPLMLSLFLASLFTPIEAILAALISAMILVQQRAAGMTATFGGTNTIQVQRRGAEKLMYQLTIIFSVVLVVMSVVQWYVA